MNKMIEFKREAAQVSDVVDITFFRQETAHLCLVVALEVARVRLDLIVEAIILSYRLLVLSALNTRNIVSKIKPSDPIQPVCHKIITTKYSLLLEIRAFCFNPSSFSNLLIHRVLGLYNLVSSDSRHIYRGHYY